MKIKSILVAALAAMTLAACSKDGKDGGGENTEETTFATITLSMAKSNATRVHHGTTAATADEKVINKFYLFVIDADDKLEKIVDFSGSNTATFETKVGAKKFIALANEGTPTLFPVGTDLEDITRHKLNTPSIASVTEDGGSNPNFWMTTTGIVPAILVPASAAEAAVTGHSNNVILPVGRAMAKVGVYYDEGNVPITGGGTFENVTYDIRNNPKQIYLLGGVDPVSKILITPEWESMAVASNYYYPAGNYQGTGLDNGEHEFPAYMIENSNRIPKRGNATYTILKGTFTPASTETWLNGATGNATTAPASGVSFWRVANVVFAADGVTVESITSWEPEFYTSNPSVSLIDPANQAAYEYVDGVCYYGLYLKDDAVAALADQYSIYRNQYWSVTITSIDGIGFPNEEGPGSPEGPDPEIPIISDTNVHAVIEIQDWVGVEMDGDLEGAN